MQVTRVKEDVNAIAYEILRRNGLSIKFKVKLRYSGMKNKECYYYNPYSFNNKNKKSYSITLSPKSYLQMDFGNEGESNGLYFISENHKNKLLRKLAKQIALLNAYEDGEIDIIKVDSNGSRISNNFPTKEQVRLGVYTVTSNVIIREEKLDIGVQFGIDDHSCVLALSDFLDLMNKLSGLNYLNMTMNILNFIGKPDDLEYNLVDFRPTKIYANDSLDITQQIAAPKSSLSGLGNIQTKTYNKSIKW